MNKYQAESVMMRSEMYSIDDGDLFSTGSKSESHKRYNSSANSKAGTAILTPRESSWYVWFS